MIYVKTRSGRFISLNHIIGFAIEDEIMEMEGKRVRVFEIIAYLPEHLYHAILAIYHDHETADKNLEKFMERLLKTQKGIISAETQL
jgi:hypothetical protein